MTDKVMIEAFRESNIIRHAWNSGGNPKAFTEGGFFSLSGLLFFYVFCFFGGYEGAVPPYSTFPSFPEFFIGNPCFCIFFGLKYCGPLIEPFRGDEQGAINTFRGDGHGGFYPCYLWSFSFVFSLFSFLGVIRGQSPLIVLLRHSRNF